MTLAQSAENTQGRSSLDDAEPHRIPGMMQAETDKPVVSSEPIRVLHVVSTFAIKTDTIWLSQLLSRCSRERLDSSIACMYGGGPMQRRFSDLGVPTFQLHAPRGISPSGLWQLLRLVRRVRPQVLHTHLLRADLYGGLAGRLSGVPVVLTSQYALFPCARAVKRRSDRVLDRLCRLFATDALAVSEAVRRDLIDRVGWPSDRVHTVRTGLDFDAWPSNLPVGMQWRKSWGIDTDSPLIVTVARLSYEKGLEVLVEAAALVSSEFPNARFLIVGEGPAAGSLAEQIAQLDLKGVVHLAGFHQDVPSILSAADLFVLPSHMEGLPNAVLEAFAAGLPVVASAVGGLPEAVEHERTGLLVPPGDAPALAAAVCRLLREPQFARLVARQGSQAAREKFSLQRVARIYAALYEELVHRQRDRRHDGKVVCRVEGFGRES